ncbi:MAG: hypothetical protein ACKO96_13255 [Flammeovirgaceae bacterium]
MIALAREHFNQQFSEEKYQQFLHSLNSAYNYTIPFRVAETPVFVGGEFKQKLLTAANEIVAELMEPNFQKKMQAALPLPLTVPHETRNTLFLALDFAVCSEVNGELVPRLIELQGFPSLFGYQDFLGTQFREQYSISNDFHFHFGLDSKAYWQLLNRAIVGNHSPENVVLLEIYPYQQNTTIDFIITQKHLGIHLLHIGDVKRKGRKLFYQKNGKEIPIHRIYNRVIFDELLQRNDLVTDFHLTEDVDVEWAGHPNWFFKISKYSMPFLKSSAVPQSRFLNEIETIPSDLENYVLKPLFSFSGSGVVFNVTAKDIEAVPEKDRNNFMLQKKVHYEPVVQAGDGLIKAEIRLLYVWEDGQPQPKLVTNLARLSRGEMIGVKYNKNKTWVGGTVCFFEQ